MITRRQILLGGLTASISAGVWAADYPSKLIRAIVPFGLAGGVDVLGRPIAEQLAQALGQPVLMDFKPGAAGMIGAAEFEKAAPDGYTIMMETSTILMVALLRKSKFNPLDWEAVAPYATVAQALLASKHLDIKSIKELVSFGKRNPGKLNYASLGVGSAGHIAALRLQRVTGIEMTHIPYKAAGEVLAALIGGQVDLVFDGASQAIPRYRDGSIRILGIASNARLPQVAEVPTFREQGIDYINSAWFSIVAPKGTPRAITDRISDEVFKIASTSAYQERAAKFGADTMPMRREEFATLRNREAEEIRDIIARENITVEV